MQGDHDDEASLGIPRRATQGVETPCRRTRGAIQPLTLATFLPPAPPPPAHLCPDEDMDNWWVRFANRLAVLFLFSAVSQLVLLWAQVVMNVRGARRGGGEEGEWLWASHRAFQTFQLLPCAGHGAFLQARRKGVGQIGERHQAIGCLSNAFCTINSNPPDRWCAAAEILSVLAKAAPDIENALIRKD